MGCLYLREEIIISYIIQSINEYKDKWVNNINNRTLNEIEINSGYIAYGNMHVANHMFINIIMIHIEGTTARAFNCVFTYNHVDVRLILEKVIHVQVGQVLRLFIGPPHVVTSREWHLRRGAQVETRHN